MQVIHVEQVNPAHGVSQYAARTTDIIRSGMQWDCLVLNYSIRVGVSVV
jgi:hypothetical protein